MRDLQLIFVSPCAVSCGRGQFSAHPACAQHQCRREAEDCVRHDSHQGTGTQILKSGLQEGRGGSHQEVGLWNFSISVKLPHTCNGRYLLCAHLSQDIPSAVKRSARFIALSARTSEKAITVTAMALLLIVKTIPSCCANWSWISKNEVTAKPK